MDYQQKYVIVPTTTKVSKYIDAKLVKYFASIRQRFTKYRTLSDLNASCQNWAGD